MDEKLVEEMAQWMFLKEDCQCPRPDCLCKKWKPGDTWKSITKGKTRDEAQVEYRLQIAREYLAAAIKPLREKLQKDLQWYHDHPLSECDEGYQDAIAVQAVLDGVLDAVNTLYGKEESDESEPTGA